MRSLYPATTTRMTSRRNPMAHKIVGRWYRQMSSQQGQAENCFPERQVQESDLEAPVVAPVAEPVILVCYSPGSELADDDTLAWEIRALHLENAIAQAGRYSVEHVQKFPLRHQRTLWRHSE